MLARTVILIFLLLATSPAASAQDGKITGVVIDAQTFQVLPFASVYINLTTMGTNADDKGEFVLNLPAGKYDMVVSYIGHKPNKKTVEVVAGGTTSMRIVLELVTLQEVQITATRDGHWFKQLDKFKRLFLGQGPTAKLCKIINPYALSFWQDKDGIFSAVSRDPLEIDNMYLGYRVSYDLKTFSVSKENYIAAGFIRFQEMETTDSLLAKTWTEHRLKAYEGSVGHFFKSAIGHQLAENSYVVYEDRSELKQIIRNSRLSPNVDKTIFIYPLETNITPGPDSSSFIIKMPERLEIHYKNDNQHSKIYWDVPYPVSWIEVKGGSLDLNASGLVLNPSKMTISGQMFEGRIDNLLPNDYHPILKKRVFIDSVSLNKDNSLSLLAEKPYLQTDRSYFYTGENIWFKAYMNYTSDIVRDSLSQVLYVDLVDTKNSVVTARTFQISKGTCLGDLSLESIYQPGDYTLRAYTRWMLNFDTAFVFKKAIKVLGSSEIARTKDYTAEPDNTGVTILTDKEEYFPREKVILSLDIRDGLDNTVKANVSISVTDLALAVPAPNEPSIVTDYKLPSVAFPDSLDKKTRLAIQHGFDLRGRFTKLNGKPAAGILNFVQQGVAAGFTVSTEDNGQFFLPDLLLYDSSKISYVARNTKGAYGLVVFDTAKILPRTKPCPPLNIEVVRTERTIRQHVSDIAMKTTLLNAVTIEDTRIAAKRTSVVAADFEVSGEWLRERHSTDVLSSIQTRVPGLRILTTYGEGYPKKTIVLSGGNSFTGLAEPLVLIDGISVNNTFDGAAQSISNLNPNEVDRVEVMKYGNSAAYGARGGNGVIAIFTRRSDGNASGNNNADYDKAKLKPLGISGFSSPNKFASPDYSSAERTKDLPDNRATIYWNPSVNADGTSPAAVSFYAADTPSQYRVLVEGVTIDGRPIRAEKIVLIKRTP